MILNRLFNRVNQERLNGVLFLKVQAKQFASLVQPLLHVEAEVIWGQAPISADSSTTRITSTRSLC